MALSKSWSALALAALAAGCVVQTQGTPVRPLVVGAPPPQPLPETQPPMPSPTAAWIAGYWHWNGIDYVWLPGHWIEAPQGKAFAPPQYFQQRGRYLYQPGGWQPQGAAPRP